MVDGITTALHFVFMGVLGSLLYVLVHAKEPKDLYGFDSLRRIAIGAIVGYLYMFLHSDYGFPDLVMTAVAGYAGSDFIMVLFEKLKVLLGVKGGQ